MKPTNIYIAGPMTGLPDLNYPAFFAYEEALLERDATLVIHNPARNIPSTSNPTHADWMRMAYHQVLQADEVHFLPGWEDSKGARLERTMAESLGLRIVDVCDTIEVPRFIVIEVWIGGERCHGIYDVAARLWVDDIQPSPCDFVQVEAARRKVVREHWYKNNVPVKGEPVAEAAEVRPMTEVAEKIMRDHFRDPRHSYDPMPGGTPQITPF